MNDDLESKIEFVEKMRRENPRAFNFLGRGATDLLTSLGDELIDELSGWYVRAVNVFGKQRTEVILRALLDKKEK